MAFLALRGWNILVVTTLESLQGQLVRCSSHHNCKAAKRLLQRHLKHAFRSPVAVLDAPCRHFVYTPSVHCRTDVGTPTVPHR